MVAKQLSIFLENKSGRLTEVTEVRKVLIFLLFALLKMPTLVFSGGLFPIRIKLIKL